MKETNDRSRLTDISGNILLENIPQSLLKPLVIAMNRRNCGQCVCRQYAYERSYEMLLINVSFDIGKGTEKVTVALWPDEDDAGYYVTKEVTFNITSNINIWYDFCESVSNKAAIFEKDLIGNFFVGHFTQKKVRYEDRTLTFENIVVDRYIGRIDPEKVEIIDEVGKSKARNNPGKTLSEIMEDD